MIVSACLIDDIAVSCICANNFCLLTICYAGAFDTCTQADKCHSIFTRTHGDTDTPPDFQFDNLLYFDFLNDLFSFVFTCDL